MFVPSQKTKQLSLALVGLGMLASCGKDQSLFAGKSAKLTADRHPVAEIMATPPAHESDDSAGAETERFSYGGLVDLADFLFVVDNSCSMNTYIDKVKAGFRAVPAADFPLNAKLGVMTTMPGDPANLSKVHPSVGAYSGIDDEPGFLSLVNAATVTKFKTPAPSHASTYPQEVCADSWFNPSDKNPKGDSCLDAALQTVGTCVGTEAGLTAVVQLMQKNSGKPFFRRGAFVHVVFVSDSHDPGNSVQVLKDSRPNFSQIKSAIEANSEVTGVKLHGLVPAGECGEISRSSDQFAFTGFSYLPEIAASLGVLLDLCTATDYKPVAQQIVKSSTPDAVFFLKSPATAVVKVVVDGTAITDFTFDLGNRITLKGLDPKKLVSIEVVYRR